MLVVRLARVGIAGGLGAPDLVGERAAHSGHVNSAALVQRDDEREGLRLPRLREHGAVGVAGLAGRELRHAGSR